MENITLADIGILVAFLVSLVSGIAYLKKHLKEWIQTAVKEDFDLLGGKVDRLQSEMSMMKEEQEKDKADNARYRILRFNDEVLQGKKHSQEHFNQVLMMISGYEHYATEHPSYPNGQAVAAIENIKRVYQKCVTENSFL